MSLLFNKLSFDIFKAFKLRFLFRLQDVLTSRNVSKIEHLQAS